MFPFIAYSWGRLQNRPLFFQKNVFILNNKYTMKLKDLTKAIFNNKISKKVAKFAFLFFFLKGIGWIIIFWFGWKIMN